MDAFCTHEGIYSEEYMLILRENEDDLGAYINRARLCSHKMKKAF